MLELSASKPVIARERSDRGDLLSFQHAKNKNQIVTPIDLGLMIFRRRGEAIQYANDSQFQPIRVECFAPTRNFKNADGMKI